MTLAFVMMSARAFVAPRPSATRGVGLRGAAGSGSLGVCGPVVLVGESRFDAETCALAASACAELGGSVKECSGGGSLAGLVAECGAGDVIRCADESLDRSDWRAVEAAPLSMWVRYMNEFGNDDVREIFRDDAHRRRTRFEVGVRAPRGRDIPARSIARSLRRRGRAAPRAIHTRLSPSLGVQSVRREDERRGEGVVLRRRERGSAACSVREPVAAERRGRGARGGLGHVFRVVDLRGLRVRGGGDVPLGARVGRVRGRVREQG